MKELTFLKTIAQLAQDDGLRKACKCAGVPVVPATKREREQRQRKIKALKAHVESGHKHKVDTLIRMRANEITITALTKMIRRTVPDGYIESFIASPWRKRPGAQPKGMADIATWGFAPPLPQHGNAPMKG